jgi:hypothetical protein
MLRRSAAKTLDTAFPLVLLDASFGDEASGQLAGEGQSLGKRLASLS